MITPEQLRELMTDLETDRVERTTSTTNTDKFAQAVCAFANDLPGHRRPGYLLVGVRDDGVPSGVTVTDQLLQNLAALRSDGNIQPLPALAVGRLAVPGGEVAVVEVTPSDLPPVRYKGQVWIRVGPRRAIASEQEERLLSERRVAFARTFDARPCPEATPENFPNQSGYRNPVVAEAMKTLGYVNRFGYGVQRAQRALAENGNPPAEFSFDSGFVAVRVKRRSQ